MFRAMKNIIRHLALAALLAAAVCAASAGEKNKEEKKETSKVTGSIRVAHGVKPAELPALAKITFSQALEAALARVPGGVIKAELEVEDGNLVYSFEIVNAQQKVAEVEVDAGNGQVLDVDED